jgi:hypothetical protein
MCGIAAHFSSNDRAAPLEPQLIAHRGPDSGEWTAPDGFCWPGNTRLTTTTMMLDGLTCTGLSAELMRSLCNAERFSMERMIAQYIEIYPSLVS